MRSSTLKADLILEEGRVHPLDGDRPPLEAVALGAGRILALGSRRDLGPLRGPQTRTLSLEGAGVYPGFVDAHVHLVAGGLLLGQLDLRSVTSREEFRQRLQTAAAGLSPGEWLLGRNWDHERMSGGTLPDLSWLDDLTPRNPVLLHRYDAHSALANSLALRLAGIAPQTADPPGGEIYRDARGQPTGFLTDRAVALVEQAVPEPSPAAVTEAARRALRLAASLGLTGLHDMSQPAHRQAYRVLREAGELPVRLWSHSYPGDGGVADQATGIRRNLEAYRRLGIRQGFGDPWLRLGAVKLFSDGALGPRTALLAEPYSDDPRRSGLELLSPGELGELVAEAQRAGIQLAIHAIGDLANRRVLDALERAQGLHPAPAARHRVEHAQVLAPQDLRRFAALGLVASVQPSHVLTDLPFTAKRLGPQRLRGAYAFRSLLESGTILAFGTDWPIDELDPLKTLYAAVARRPPGAAEPWLGEERLTLRQALRAQTWGPSYASFQEGELGTLEPGKRADLTVLSRDLLELEDEEAILEARVALTIAGGQITYSG